MVVYVLSGKMLLRIERDTKALARKMLWVLLKWKQ